MKNKGVSTGLVFLPHWPQLKRGASALPDPSNTVVIFDRRLLRISPEFREWLKPYRYRYPVQAGEGLKDLRDFSNHVQKLVKLSQPLAPRSMTVLAVGGGSVGDFAGFFASIYKRGVRLVHVPSTWLAAIDSAHGGKTALNVGDVKNVVGSFYPAERVILIESLLLRQPEDRIADAMGELGKIALIDGGAWVRSLEKTSLSGAKLLWKFLKPAIEAKLRVVSQDPKEQTGVRQILNLGHTVGHVCEMVLRMSHGVAVAQGLFFALEFSFKRGLLSEKENERAWRLLVSKLGLFPSLPSRKISARVFAEILKQDKKKSSPSDVTYIFLRRIGQAERDSIAFDEILGEAQRQGWVAKK